MAKRKEMSDKEFKRRLDAGMRKAGIPCPNMREAIKKGMMFGHTIQTHDISHEERSLAGWLEAKQYRDEVRTCLGRSATWDEWFY